MKPYAIVFFVFLLLFSCSSDYFDLVENEQIEPPTIEFNIQITSGDGGNVNTSGGTFSEGERIEFTATPNPGYRFISWSDGVASVTRTLTVNSNLSLEANFERIEVYFSSKSPQYPAINLTSSTVKNNYFHPGSLLTSEQILNQIWIRENCDCLGCGCRTNYALESSKYFDFNQDNKLDLFGFLRNDSDGYAVSWGKYFLVEDVFNEFNVHYFEAETWFAGRFEINDFNNDGRDDVLIFASDDHENLTGGHFTDRTPLKIIYFNDDATINLTRIGEPTSTHDLTTFDLDQDGDIDIVNFEWWMKDGTPNHPEVPLFYINDGNGDFTIQTTNFLEASFYIERELDYIFTAVESFDINDDGYLDLIVGYDNHWETNYCEWDSMGNSNCYDLDFSQDIRIFLGNENGVFSENNAIRIDLANNSFGTNIILLGLGLIDFNLDGKYDIVANGSDGSYSGGFLRLFENIDGENFEDVTAQLIDIHEWEYASSAVNTGDIPIFYYPAIVDVDGDGLFDIMPYEINSGALLYDDVTGRYDWETNIGPNFHWRNIGGRFQLINDRLNYQN